MCFSFDRLINLIKAVEQLQTLDNGTTRFEEVLESYPKVNEIEKLKQHKENLLV